MGEMQRTMLAFGTGRVKPVRLLVDPLKPSPRKEALEQREACEPREPSRVPDPPKTIPRGRLEQREAFEPCDLPPLEGGMVLLLMLVSGSIMNGQISSPEATKVTMGIRCRRELKELIVVQRECRSNWTLW